MTKIYLIYWEAQGKRGFVSYDNPQFGKLKHEEYEPVDIANATVYTDKKKAESTMYWYRQRSLGDFWLVEMSR